MARTKQTARKSCVPAGMPPKMGFKGISKGKGGKGACGPPLKGRPIIAGHISESEQESEMVEEVNTQQFSVKFDDQEKCQKTCVSGQMVSCSNCSAILTAQSSILLGSVYETMKSNEALTDASKHKFLTHHQRVWICEFCLTHNNVKEDYDCPPIQNPCYLLHKAGRQNRSKRNEKKGDKLLIFCIDTSGSMDFMVPVKTRLDCLKQTVLDELKRMKVEKENVKVGLIAFSSEVNLLTGPIKNAIQRKIPHELYAQFQILINHCANMVNICVPIQKSLPELKKKVQELEPYGGTELEAAVLAAIEFASKGTIGSKIILCTDGEGMSRIPNFYNRAADYAKKQHVEVNIVSLKGDRCNLKELSKLSSATGGSILKVDTSLLGTEFAKISRQEVIGSDSVLTIHVNKIFQIDHETQSQLSVDKTVLTQQFGNFRADTQLTFSFRILSQQQSRIKSTIDLQLYKCPRVPMQVQLSYTSRDGNTYLQIITDWRQLTLNKEDIFTDMNFGLFSASTLQKVSKSIKNQKYQEAERVIKNYWILVKDKFQKTQTKEQLNKFATRIKKLETIIKTKQGKNSGNKSKKSAIPRKKKIVKAVRGGRGGRGRGGKRTRVLRGSDESVSESHYQSLGSISGRQEEEENDDEMSSDSIVRHVQRQMRARSRSCSPE